MIDETKRKTDVEKHEEKLCTCFIVQREGVDQNLCPIGILERLKNRKRQ